MRRILHHVKKAAGLFLLCGIVATSTAQKLYTIGNGTESNAASDYPCPIPDRYEANRSQYLYLASELNAKGMTGAGKISSISFVVTSIDGVGISEQYTIKVGGTSVTSLNTGTWEASPAMVYGPVDFAPILGLNTFTFSSPISWNGTDNLLVEICSGDPGNGGTGVALYSTNPRVQLTTGLAFNGSHNYRADNIGYGCNAATTTNTGLATSRPNAGFYFTSDIECTSPPTPGTALSSSVYVCAGEIFQLGLSGETKGATQTYLWQSSPDSSNWTNLGSETLSYAIRSQSATTYYRSLITCGGNSAASAGVKVVTPLSLQGIYSINSGAATGNGNFNNFTDAVNFIKCGINGPVVFNVQPGTSYYEQVEFPEIPGTSSVNTITINGNGANISFNSSNTEKRAGITLNGIDHLIIDSLNIDGSAGTYGWGIFLTNAADSNTIKRCTIQVSTTDAVINNHAGIVVSNSPSSVTSQGNNGNYNTIINNRTVGGYHGIVIYGPTSSSGTPFTKGNKCIGNMVQDYSSYGIYTYGQDDLLISGNDVSRPTRDNTSNNTYGIWNGNSFGSLIEKNRVHNLFGNILGSSSSSFLFYITSSDATTAQPNKIVNNLGYDIVSNSSIYGLYNGSSDTTYYYHNTIVINDLSATGGTVYGQYQTTTATDVQFKNNMIYINRGGSSNKRCIQVNTTSSEVKADNNVYFMATSGTSDKIGQFGSLSADSYTTLAEWKTANGNAYDQNSVSIDPLFTNIAGFNFIPTETSIFNIGASGTGVNDDINGAPRTPTSTPGAYATGTGLPVTMLNIDAIRNGNDVRVSWSTLTETNNKGFDIERSTDGRSFHKIGFAGSKASSGNSNSRIDYDYVDAQAPSSEVYYRLKQFDNNGKSQNSNIVRVKGISNRRFDITNLYPNPSHKTDLTLMMSAQANSKVSLLVSDVTGKVLLQQSETLTQGNNTLKVSVSNLPAGTYFIRAICNDGCESSVKKFMIQ